MKETSAIGSNVTQMPHTLYELVTVALVAGCDHLGNTIMRLTASTQIKGTIVSVRKGTTIAHVRVDIGGGVIVTSSLTNEAVDELGLAMDQVVFAVINASDVMIGVP